MRADLMQPFIRRFFLNLHKLHSVISPLTISSSFKTQAATFARLQLKQGPRNLWNPLKSKAGYRRARLRRLQFHFFCVSESRLNPPPYDNTIKSANCIYRPLSLTSLDAMSASNILNGPPPILLQPKSLTRLLKRALTPQLSSILYFSVTLFLLTNRPH